MDISALIPAPDSIPVHWGWLRFFLNLTFTLHILFMNTMLGLGFISLVYAVKGKNEPSAAARDTAETLPSVIALTINMGVAPFLFLQVLYGQFLYTSSILMAVYWLSVIGFLMIAYYGAYIYDFKFDALGKSRVFFIGLTVAFMLIIAFLFSNNMTLMLRPEKWTAWFANPEGLLLNLSDPTLIPRYLHFVISAAAVGGLFLDLKKRWRQNAGRTPDPSPDPPGLKWFTHATLLQIPVGLWFFMSLPADVRGIFMGQNPLATTLFILGLAGTVLALVMGFKNKLLPCAGAALFTIIAMVLTRDMARAALLRPWF
ncbi:MAG: hypothetical protein GY859_32840, partial [Desulfobacterales bacterium]|nr:hypothetical protein [Desulfobacterales bacterium]